VRSRYPCHGAVNQCGTAGKRAFPTLQPVPVPADPQERLGEGPVLLAYSQFWPPSLALLVIQVESGQLQIKLPFGAEVDKNQVDMWEKMPSTAEGAV
jgi:hypothetical protein